MKITLREIDSSNREECIALRVSQEQASYIASNEDSLREADECPEIARPFGIYEEETMVGFAMFAFDLQYKDPDDRYWLWRFMIDETLQGRGYGTQALQTIIGYFRTHGADHIRLSTKEHNHGALSLYRKAGFRETGELNDGEIVLKLKL